MEVTLVGLNHKTASVDIRERLAFDQEAALAALKRLRDEFPRAEFVLLSTCNRMELYIASRADQKPDIEPIKLKIESCSSKLYNDKVITLNDVNSLVTQDSANRTKAIEDGKGEEFVSEMSKVKICGHKYETEIYSLSDYLDFF